MKFDVFKKVVGAIISIERIIDILDQINIDISNSDIYLYGVISDSLWDIYYTEDGIELLNEWLYSDSRDFTSVEDIYNELETKYSKNV